VTAPLAALAVLLAFAALWELRGALEGRVGPRASAALARLTGGRAGSIDETAARLGLPGRIARAGLAGRLRAEAVVAAKLAGAVVGGLVALLASPALPARLAPLGAGGLLAAGFVAPDALLERAARRRRGRFVGALPDALDMLAVGAAAGRNPTVVFGEIAGGTTGPLAVEFGTAVAEIECGRPPREALASVRERIPGAEVGALAAALERSRRYGSPLAEQLHAQATGLRRDARRRIDERAARAAPKIQLVVALVLVPSVLLMIAGAIIAHSDALFGSLSG
jgi:tight adherence protein C